MESCSARNQLKGKITGIELGTIMAEVVVNVGGQEVVATLPAIRSSTSPSNPATM